MPLCQPSVETSRDGRALGRHGAIGLKHVPRNLLNARQVDGLQIAHVDRVPNKNRKHSA